MPFMPNLGQLSKLMSRKLSQSLTLGAAILALSAGTAQAQIAGAPANPTTNCSWNWNGMHILWNGPQDLEPWWKIITYINCHVHMYIW